MITYCCTFSAAYRDGGHALPWVRSRGYLLIVAANHAQARDLAAAAAGNDYADVRPIDDVDLSYYPLGALARLRVEVLT